MHLVKVGTENLDWFVIEDTKGRQHTYVRAGTAVVGSMVHIEAWPIAGKVEFCKGDDGKPLLNGDELPERIILMMPVGEVFQAPSSLGLALGYHPGTYEYLKSQEEPPSES
jgi:hypothetical protein